MRPCFRRLIWLIPLVLVSVLAGGCMEGGWGQGGLTPRGPQQPVLFTLGVEQDGQRLPMRDHKVQLRKAPFRIVFYFDRLGSMLVQASDRPEILQAAAKGAGMDELLIPDAPFAEHFKNPEKVLFLDSRGAYHNWGYFGPDMHKFDSDGVVELPEREGGGYLCGRTVQRLQAGSRRVDVEQLPTDELFLVFLKTEQTPAGRVERQRDWLTLEFTK